jgi:mediator of RNA polymerase II transcription subunit 18
MHELLLIGSVVQSRHDQVLKVLAGLAAMQPRRTLERIIIYKPEREPDEPGLVQKRGGTQDVAMKQTKQTGLKDLFFTKLVQHLTQANLNSGAALTPAVNAPIAGVKPHWTWEFTDLPEAGDRGGVLVRLAHTTNITEGDPHAYMVDGGHRYGTIFYYE